MSWTEEQAQALRNIKYRSTEAHRALDGLLPGEFTSAETWQGAVSFAIHLLATGLEEAIAFIEKMDLPQEPGTWTGVLKAGEQELRIEGCSRTSVHGLVTTAYQANEPYRLVTDGYPNGIVPTNGGDLILTWTNPFSEDLLIAVAAP